MSSTWIGILLLVSFIIMIVYLVRGGNPVLTMIVMAVLWAVLGGYNFNEVITNVFQGTIENYAGTIMTIVFGAWFAQVIVQTGIASSLIRSAVELGGDKPGIVVTLIMIVVGFLFTSMFGVGPTIAVGVIVLPIMMSMGISTRIAVAALTIPVGLASGINIAQYQVVSAFFDEGVATFGSPYLPYGYVAFGIGLVISIFILCFQLKKGKENRACAVANYEREQTAKVKWYAYLTPLVPVLVVMILKWSIYPAFILGILYALLTTYKKGTKPFNTASKAFCDGLSDSGGMILFFLCAFAFADSAKLVTPILGNLLTPILPKSMLVLVIFCAVLIPLVVYRGPMCLVGAGIAVYSTLLAAGNISPVFIWVVAYSMETLHYYLDPTNSTVVWAMGYTKLKPIEYLKTAVPIGWIVGAVCLFVAYFMVRGLV